MPVRGQRAIYPEKGRRPSGIFSTSGRQKLDGTDGYRKGLMNYALGKSARSKPKGGGDKGLRHQAPKRRK